MPVDRSGGYHGHGETSSNRVELFLDRIADWLEDSFVGRAYRTVSAKLWNWWYPTSEHPRHRRENRLERSLRRGNRWLRKTWLGRKLEWVLDDMAQLYRVLRVQFHEQFGTRRFRRWLYRWQTLAWAVFLLALPLAGYAYGWPRLQKYQQGHYASQAEGLLNQGDWKRALIRSRQVLSMNISNAIATRVFADVMDNFGSAAALYWRQRALLLGPGFTNQIALASTAVRVEQFPFPTATKVLNGIGSVSQQTADYQRVAGALSLKLSNLREAEEHFREACKLDPDNPANRMSLAVIQLQSKNPKIISDSRTTLELLMNDRQVGLVATRSLVAESIDRGNLNRAEELSVLLLKNARSTFSDRILHLVILNAKHSTNFNSFLKETQERAKSSPAFVGSLVAWMNAAGFARQAVDWFDHLPPEFVTWGLLPIAKADAYVSLGQWKELESYLQRRSWPGLDHIRFAMMALARVKQNGDLQNSVAWQSAIHFANSPDALNTLAKLAAAWGWPERTQDVLWLADQLYPDQPWPLAALNQIYVGQKDTKGMWRVAKAKSQRHPDDKLAGNNYAMLSLLLNSDTTQALKYAADLHSAEPTNPVFASTYAFSLYRQGRARDGVKILSALPPDQLTDPAMAVYYGILLAAAGEETAAKPYLKQSDKAFLLPEEQALVAQAKIGLLK